MVRTEQQTRASLRKMLVPLALAQFICSFAGSNMNVMITDIEADLHTTVQAVQVCITLFLLVMAALMIPGGKLTDRLGRKRCFIVGLIIYGLGAVISAVAPPGCTSLHYLVPTGHGAKLQMNWARASGTMGHITRREWEAAVRLAS
jgi:MFS family permease